MKVLMVCLGNICRSPLAEGILKHKVKLAKLAWEVDSCGTGAYHVGDLPDSRSISKAKEYGIDLTDQRARQFRSSDIDEFDLIYAMDASNYQHIIKYTHNEQDANKVKLILNESIPGMNQTVPDPYWNDNGFEEVYQMLDKACDKIIEKYK
ncbi:UNVERIFIED_CONTAM: hypothetical protein GTU68_030275 [Idotea baltica]|nr:hypothetical protein [Idotea baltica]